MHSGETANKITAANAGQRFGFAGKSRVGLSPRPGVAEFVRRLAHRTQKHFNGNYENDPKNDSRCLRSIFHLVRR
jgi:hypothetical protein